MSAPTKQNGRRSYQKSGYFKRKRDINRRGLDGIDARTIEGKDALTFRDNAVVEQGGDDVSTTKRAAIDIATGERYLWRFGWAFIMQSDGNVINKRKKAFYPIVTDTIKVGQSLMQHLKDMGFKRVEKIMSLEQLLEQDGDGETGEESRE